jgi:hypothetical protein
MTGSFQQILFGQSQKRLMESPVKTGRWLVESSSSFQFQRELESVKECAAQKL